MTTNMTIDTEAAASVSPPGTTTHPKSPVSKVIVAQSDFDHALQAMDAVVLKSECNNFKTGDDATTTTDDNDEAMEEAVGENKSKQKGDHNDATNKKDDDKDEKEASSAAKEAFLAHVHQSLKERLYQIAEPIPDEEFHKRARGPMLKQQIDDETEDERILVAQEKAAQKAEEDALRNEEMVHEMEYNEAYDAHELLDPEAVKRARELRSQVRAMASEMQQRQGAILERAIHLAQREVRLLTDDILLEEAKQATNNMSDDKDDNENDVANRDIYDARRVVLKQMEVSLQALMDSLSKTVEGELPNNLRDLKDTIGNIEKSLQKKHQPESMSQTEQAILSRNNEGGSSGVNNKGDLDRIAVIEEEGFGDMSNPYVLLADFLGKY